MKENKSPKKIKSKVAKRARRKGIFTKPTWVDEVERKMSHMGKKMKKSKCLKVWKVKGTGILNVETNLAWDPG